MRATIARFGIATGLALTLAPAVPARAGGGCHEIGVRAEGTTEIALRGNCFEPALARVEIGETVTWTNLETTTHTVTPANLAFGNFRGELALDDTYHATFDSAGIYPYACLYHPGMAGAVIVGGDDAVFTALDDPARTTIVSDPARMAAVTEPRAGTAAWPTAGLSVAGLVFGGAGGWLLGRTRRPQRSDIA